MRVLFLAVLLAGCGADKVYCPKDCPNVYTPPAPPGGHGGIGRQTPPAPKPTPTDAGDAGSD